MSPPRSSHPVGLLEDLAINLYLLFQLTIGRSSSCALHAEGICSIMSAKQCGLGLQESRVPLFGAAF